MAWGGGGGGGGGGAQGIGCRHFLNKKIKTKASVNSTQS